MRFRDLVSARRNLRFVRVVVILILVGARGRHWADAAAAAVDEGFQTPECSEDGDAPDKVSHGDPPPGEASRDVEVGDAPVNPERSSSQRSSTSWASCVVAHGVTIACVLIVQHVCAEHFSLDFALRRREKGLRYDDETGRRPVLFDGVALRRSAFAIGRGSARRRGNTSGRRRPGERRRCGGSSRHCCRRSAGDAQSTRQHHHHRDADDPGACGAGWRGKHR